MNPFLQELLDHEPRYVAFANGRLRASHDAEDAVSMAKMKLIRREHETPEQYQRDLVRYHPRAILVYTIVRHCCIDRLRRRRGESDLTEDFADESPPVVDAPTLAELGAALAAATKKIPTDAAKQIEAVLTWLDLWVAHGEPPSFEQLADRLGASPIAAKCNLRLGRNRLREWLIDNGNPDLF